MDLPNFEKPISRSSRRLCKVSLLVLLIGCSSPEPFTLQFPSDANLGKLSVREDVNCYTCGNGVTELGDATGSHQIRLPAQHWYVSLNMPKTASHLLAYLQHPSLRKLGKIDLRDSDVTDSDLTNLASIPLQYIDLKNTQITGQGLSSIKPDPRWIRVDLTGCNRLDPKYLAHFKGWKKATIVLPYPLNDHRRTLARQFICNGQPEETCKTQLR